MRLPPDRRLDLLALLGDERPMQALIAGLRTAGFSVDTATSLGDAHKAFFGCGGHHCLMIGPDVPVVTASSVLGSLREVDPDLPAVTFGREVQCAVAPSRTSRLGFHPGSRAGIGALLRFLRTMPERG